MNAINRNSLIVCCLLASTAAFAASGMHPTPQMRPLQMTTAPTAHSASTSSVRAPAQTGQPNQSCGSATAPFTPGNAAAAPGSAFNPSGQAGTVYAGQQPQNSRNTASVSQYDVACFHQR